MSVCKLYKMSGNSGIVSILSTFMASIIEYYIEQALPKLKLSRQICVL